ncbi:hypothetical protein HDU77_007915 [Chytriomyces hyalinus]|nr:hypothetical protein HDU77_007915 [Chytriomyces hyalinus]
MPLDALNLCFSTIGAIVSVAGFIATLAAIIPNMQHIPKLAPSSFLVFWLCLFDCVTIANSGLISVTNLVTGEVGGNSVLCQFRASVAVFGTISSLLLCFGLTLFRYLLVVHQKDLPRNFTTWYFMGVAVFSALVAVLPFMMGSQEQTYIMRPCNAHCALDWSHRDVRSAIMTCICFGIGAVTLCFIVYAYAAMAGTIIQVFTSVKNVGRPSVKPDKNRKSPLETDKTERMSSAGQTSDSAGTEDGTSSHISNQKNRHSRDAKSALNLDKRQRDIMKQSVVVVAAFMIGWTPYICMAIFEFISNSQASPVFDFITTIIVATYELVNPLIIIYFDRDIGRNFSLYQDRGASMYYKRVVLVKNFAERVASRDRFHAAVNVFGSISSILLCFGLALFRYLIVVHQRDLPKNFTTFYVMGVVAFSAVVSLLPFMMGSQERIYILRPSNAHCAPDWSQHDVQSSVLIWICFSVATMTLCFVVYAYAAMAATVVQVFAGVKTFGSSNSKSVKNRKSRVLTDKTERMSRANQASYSTPTQEGSNTSSHISSPKNSLTGDAQNVMKLDKRQRDLMKQSIVVVSAFMIGWTPYLCS